MRDYYPKTHTDRGEIYTKQEWLKFRDGYNENFFKYVEHIEILFANPPKVGRLINYLDKDGEVILQEEA